jgi:hypothetical protein
MAFRGVSRLVASIDALCASSRDKTRYRKSEKWRTELAVWPRQKRMTLRMRCDWNKYSDTLLADCAKLRRADSNFPKKGFRGDVLAHRPCAVDVL